MKLKTLKDMETTGVECMTGCFDETKEPIVNVKDLRKEAIKYIKHFKNRNYFSQDDVEIINRINWIKYFFNITGEELTESDENR